MKIQLSTGWEILLFSVVCSAQSEMRQKHLSAKVCFERFESNGAINVHETVIKLSNQQSLSLIGGQTGCMYVAPGAYSFKILACKAFEAPCQKWSSENYKFTVKDGSPALFEIYPTSIGPSYTGYFAARRLGKNARR